MNDPQTFSNLHLTIHDYTICPISTGLFALDGGAMFGTVPKVLWQKTNPTDENNRISMEARALLLKSKRRHILVDTGNGTDFVEKYGDKLGTKFTSLYGVQPGGASLISSLKSFGLDPEDITDVILTHLHFDHAGGATHWNGHAVAPTFPKATYHVQAANLINAQNANVRERASYLAPNFEPLLAKGVLKTYDGPVENIFPGVSLVLSDGHTQGQQLVRVHDEKATLFYCGDLIPTSTHIRLPWIMGYDINPMQIITEKQKILTEAARGNWYLFFEHDPFCALATVQAAGSDFQLKERFQLV